MAGGMLRNGVTTGGVAAILMTLFVEATSPRSSRIETVLEMSVLPKFREFLDSFAVRNRWDAAMAERLGSACEETLLTLIGHEGRPEDAIRPRRLRLAARREGREAVLEFVVTPHDDNMQDRLAMIGDEPGEVSDEREVSLRLLRNVASSVRHRQYHGTDIVTVRVAAPESSVD